MSDLFKRFLVRKKTAGMTLAAVVSAFALAGLGTASTAHLTGPPAAKSAAAETAPAAAAWVPRFLCRPGEEAEPHGGECENNQD